MADLFDDLFGNTNKIDPLGPTQTREMKVEVVHGEERMVQITRIEREINGILNAIEDVKYLCQRCGIEWVIPGVNGFIKNKRVLCPKCSWIALAKNLSKPIWSLFFKPDDNK